MKTLPINELKAGMIVRPTNVGEAFSDTIVVAHDVAARRVKFIRPHAIVPLYDNLDFMASGYSRCEEYEYYYSEYGQSLETFFLLGETVDYRGGMKPTVPDTRHRPCDVRMALSKIARETDFVSNTHDAIVKLGHNWRGEIPDRDEVAHVVAFCIANVADGERLSYGNMAGTGGIEAHYRVKDDGEVEVGLRYCPTWYYRAL